MRKEALAEWLEKRGRNIKKEGKSVAPGFFPEVIHQFRTETKKLRAMLRLIGMEAEKELKLPKPFHSLYRAAGSIRDRQMQIQYLATDKRYTLPAFAVWLARQAGDAARKWKRTYSGSTLRELRDYIRQLTLTHMDLHTLLRYFTEHLEKMRSLTKDDPDDEALHEVRKQAKDMEYILSSCKKDWPEAYQFIRPLEKGLEHLSAKAGAYNDRRNLLKLLEQFRLEYKAEPDEKQEAEIARAALDWTEAKPKSARPCLIPSAS